MCVCATVCVVVVFFSRRERNNTFDTRINDKHTWCGWVVNIFFLDRCIPRLLLPYHDYDEPTNLTTTTTSYVLKFYTGTGQHYPFVILWRTNIKKTHNESPPI